MSGLRSRPSGIATTPGDNQDVGAPSPGFFPEGASPETEGPKAHQQYNEVPLVYVQNTTCRSILKTDCYIFLSVRSITGEATIHYSQFWHYSTQRFRREYYDGDHKIASCSAFTGSHHRQMALPLHHWHQNGTSSCQQFVCY